MNFNDFEQALSTYPKHKIVFIGLGNELRGDDGAGLIFLKRLKNSKKFRPSFYINAGTNPENYLQIILNLKADLIVFIDAAHGSGMPGEITWIPADQIDTLAISTHTFSLKMVENYLRLHQNLTFKYLIIVPLSTQLNDRLSDKVENSIIQFFNLKQR